MGVERAVRKGGGEKKGSSILRSRSHTNFSMARRFGGDISNEICEKLRDYIRCVCVTCALLAPTADFAKLQGSWERHYMCHKHLLPYIVHPV